MLVVKIELWPHGDEKRAREIGGMLIINDGTGTEQLGNYEAELLHSGDYAGRPGAWRKGKVTGFRRRASVYHLIAKVLKACGVNP